MDAETTGTFVALLRRYRAAAGLTQEELAARTGLTPQGISLLERGVRQRPQAYTVQQLAEALGLPAPERATFEAAARQVAAAVPARRHDWGDAPAVPVLQGRAPELATLARWVCEERCRVVAVLGIGGIGKTTVAAQLARDLAPAFVVAYWRSLRNALPAAEWLAGAIAAVSAGHALLPEGLDARLGLLLELLRAQRGLLCWTTWRPSWSPARPRYATGRTTKAMGRCCGGWARARTRAACC